MKCPLSGESVDLCYEMLTEGRQFLAIILEELGGKMMSVSKEGVRMIAAKGAICGDLSTSLSASSSNTGQEADESTFPDAQDDGDDGVCH